MRGRARGSALLAIFGVVAAVVYGCGGSSNSTTGPSAGAGGGSSGAVVQGQLVNRQTASGESTIVVVLRTALGIGLAEAANGDAVAGATVTLTRQGDGATATTHTDSAGSFTFGDVLPGTYTITVTGKTIDPPVAPFTVGAGDLANVAGTVTENTVKFPLDGVTVVAAETDGAIILQNDAQVAHLLNIAKAAGLVSADPVLKLREAGWGWGKIAQHFNVSPSVIGLGHGGVSDSDVADFQASHGQDNGHGNGKGKSKGKNA